MRVLPWFCLAVVLGCHSTPPQLSPIQQRQAAIVETRLGWFADTIPIVRFNPPFIYGSWRLRVETCSGLTKSGWPAFFVAPINPLRSDFAVGIYAPSSQAIVFALGEEDEGWVVAHELLHWLAAPRNTKDHPDDLFGRTSPCGPFVNPPQG